MNPKRIEPMTFQYKNLIAVAAMLEAVSPNGATYVVEDVYFDLGQDWMWTTICRRGYRDCQVLCPRDWELVVMAQTVADLAAAAESIRNDRYFGDK